MVTIIIIFAVLYIVIGYLVTENNAKYILAGYNTMSEEERKKILLKPLLRFFKRFHLFLGISSLIICLALYYFVNDEVTGFFLVLYPLLAYIYFAVRSTKYTKGLKNNNGKVAIVVLVFVSIIIGVLIPYGYSENKLIMHSDTIEINGVYGEKIKFKDVESVVLLQDLPKIRYKSNGYALGSVSKGWFKTDNEKVKLILNTNTGPYILITKTDGQKVYYVAKSGSTEEQFLELKKQLL